jgi:hypothetical protein
LCDAGPLWIKRRHYHRTGGRGDQGIFADIPQGMSLTDYFYVYVARHRSGQGETPFIIAPPSKYDVIFWNLVKWELSLFWGLGIPIPPCSTSSVSATQKPGRDNPPLYSRTATRIVTSSCNSTPPALWTWVSPAFQKQLEAHVSLGQIYTWTESADVCVDLVFSVDLIPVSYPDLSQNGDMHI